MAYELLFMCLFAVVRLSKPKYRLILIALSFWSFGSCQLHHLQFLFFIVLARSSQMKINMQNKEKIKKKLSETM